MEKALESSFSAVLREVQRRQRHVRILTKMGIGLFRRRLPLNQKSLLFILGCQRSGTTLMTYIFERDWQARVFSERSVLSSEDARRGLRLNRLDKVAAALDRMPYPFLIAKPLVESQNALNLLKGFPNARILWLYRDFWDVVASNVSFFGPRNGIENIRPIVIGDRSDWRAESVDAETRNLVARHFAEDMNIYDAAALYWFTRNILYFQNGLDRTELRPRVLLLRYEQLIREPDEAMGRVYALAGRSFPGRHLVTEVHQRSVGKGQTGLLSPEIGAACKTLLDRLDGAASAQR